MSTMKRLLITILLLVSPILQSRTNNEAIYGEDNRVYVEEFDSPAIQTLSLSVGAIVHESRIEPQGDRIKIWGEKLSESHYVCEDERFANDFTTVKCTGFLVGPDLFLTAGHCIKGPTDCENKKILLNFKKSLLQTIDEENSSFPVENMYGCKEIIHREYDYETQNDYSLIKLDRKVKDREPLLYRGANKIGDKENLFVIGHPSGLAQVIALGKVIKNENPYFFSTNLDTFSGNSGGPVFNAQTLEVEGILVRGEQDYVMDDDIDCDRPRVCEEDGKDCMGEEVVRITNIPELVPNFDLPGPPIPIEPSRDDTPSNGNDDDEIPWDDFFGDHY